MVLSGFAVVVSPLVAGVSVVESGALVSGAEVSGEVPVVPSAPGADVAASEVPVGSSVPGAVVSEVESDVPGVTVVIVPSPSLRQPIIPVMTVSRRSTESTADKCLLVFCDMGLILSLF